MHTLLRDVKFAWRSFGQTPGFTAPVVLSLAMGIGANTAIFTLTNAVFLNPLPVEEPSRVLETFTVDHRTVVTGAPLPRGAMSFPNYEDFRDQNEVFSGLTAIQEVLAQGTTIGVYSRMALGARPMDVLRLVIGQSMRLTAGWRRPRNSWSDDGTRFAGSLLFDVSPYDPLTFLAVACVLAGAASGADRSGACAAPGIGAPAHSWRSAAIGSARVARRAGIQHATPAVTVTRPAATKIEAG